jgi:hypothetical protein
MARCFREPRYISGHASVASASVAWEVAKMATRAARPQGTAAGRSGERWGFSQIMGEFSMNLSQKLGFSRCSWENFEWIWARNWDLVISTGHVDRISMNLMMMMMIFIGDYRWGLLFAILSWIRVIHQAVTGGHHLVQIYPIGSMVLLYMVTWIPSIYPLYVSINIPAPCILWVWLMW